MKFIIVDDCKTFREALKYYLEEIHGHQVIQMVSDGAEFLKTPNFSEADMVIMDIEMPHLNGIETVKRALWENQRLQFIAVTAYTDKAYLIELISSGFKACIYKHNIYQNLEQAIKDVANKKIFFPREIKIKPDKIS